LTASIVGWPEGKVAPLAFTAEVGKPLTKIKPEPISKRLLRSFPHPDRDSSIGNITFRNKDELIVSGYPSGIVQVIGPQTGKDLRTIRTPRGYRGSLNYLQISKARDLLVVALDNSKFEPLREGEKKTYFRRYSGEIQLFDLGSGKQTGTLRADPQRGVMLCAISPDGRKIATMEYSSGKTEHFDKLRAIYLWDVATRKATKVRDGYADVQFSPDGKTLYVIVDDHAAKTGKLFAYSVQTGKLVASRESKKGVWSKLVFSPDGKLIAASGTDEKTGRPVVHLLNPAGLALKGTLTAPLPATVKWLGHVNFSPDGKHLAAVGGNKVLIWDVKGNLVRDWALDTPGRVWSLSFSPKGGLLAASTWYIPPELEGARDEAVTPQDYPQPRVFLLPTGGAKPETIVCPHGWWGKVAFSPDGKFLAVGGAGAVHLFDVEKK
jgi:WD40 repeat protein